MNIKSLDYNQNIIIIFKIISNKVPFRANYVSLVILYEKIREISKTIPVDHWKKKRYSKVSAFFARLGI